MNKLQVLKNYLNYVIEHKNYHCWSNTTKCHCGLLLKSVNIDPNEFATLSKLGKELMDVVLIDEGTNWYKAIFNYYKTNYCEVTNEPFTEVVNKLVSYGFTLDELANLEHLQDKRFIDIDINSNEVKQVDNLIVYLTNWIKYEEQLVKASTKETVTVNQRVITSSCSK